VKAEHGGILMRISPNGTEACISVLRPELYRNGALKLTRDGWRILRSSNRDSKNASVALAPPWGGCYQMQALDLLRRMRSASVSMW